MINHLEKLLKLYPNESWNWEYIYGNPNITWEIITQNPYKPWDWYGISQNPNITWEIITQNLDKPWDWRGISMNKFTKCKILQRIKAQKIKNCWKRYILKKFIKQCALKYHIKCLIENMPNRGIQYFELINGLDGNNIQYSIENPLYRGT